MFKIICSNCNEEVKIFEGKNKSNIQLQGQIEVLYDADVYISCKSCGNEVTIENG